VTHQRVTHTLTTMREIDPSGATRNNMPTCVTLPAASTRTGTASTYTMGSRDRATSISSSESHCSWVSVVTSAPLTISLSQIGAAEV
jgi:hypothetical protein